MAIKRPAPKQLSQETSQMILNSGASWTGSSRPKSYDPDFPVFEVPINKKVLAYIPNHTVQAEDGSIVLRENLFPAHHCQIGRSHYDIRCINGQINDDPQLNWDGTCPLCEGLQEVWDLYNLQVKDIATSRGLDPNAEETKTIIKPERIELLTNRAIKEPEMWKVFPIVVVDCEEKDGVATTVPKLNAEGRLTGKPMWYCIRQKTFEDKWEAGYDGIEAADGSTPTNPAGLWAVLNFTCNPKNGAPDKMQSAKALKVTYKSMEGYHEWANYFDSITEAWTPEKAIEVVELASVRSMEETREVVDEVLKKTRENIQLYSLKNGGVGTQTQASQTTAENALSQFGAAPGVPATPQTPAGNIIGEMPNAGVQV